MAAWFLAMALCLWVGSAGGAEQFSAGPKHRGVQAIGPYQVFPENRPGNGVYLNRKLVFTAPGLTVVDVLPLLEPGQFAYFTRDEAGNAGLDAVVGEGNKKARVSPVAAGIYHMVAVLNGIPYKKVFRIVDEKIIDVLPSSKTADGVVAGSDGVLFYHVATRNQEEENGSVKFTYGLRLHLVRFDDERVLHLNYSINNERPSLGLKWLDKTRIQVLLSQDRKETLSISQFQ